MDNNKEFVDNWQETKFVISFEKVEFCNEIVSEIDNFIPDTYARTERKFMMNQGHSQEVEVWTKNFYVGIGSKKDTLYMYLSDVQDEYHNYSGFIQIFNILDEEDAPLFKVGMVSIKGLLSKLKLCNDRKVERRYISNQYKFENGCFIIEFDRHNYKIAK